MKKTIFIIALILGSYSLYSQEDTTKIKLGDTKIIIIDKEKSSKTKNEKLESAKAEFEKLLQEKERAIEVQQSQMEKLQQQIETQQKKVEEQTDQAQKLEEDLKLQDLNKQIAENEKKVAELEKEVDALEKGIEGVENELNQKDDSDFEVDVEKEDDEDWKDNKFDWDFDHDWSHSWDNLSPFGHNKKFRGHWAGFELGLNNYINSDRKFTLSEADQGFELDPGKSWTFALNFLELNIPFTRHVGIVTGLGTNWSNYHFRNNVNFFEDTAGIMVAEEETVKSYNKNSIHSWNFTFPLILEFQIPSGKRSSGIYLGVGAYGTAKVSSWGKLEYQLDGVKYEERRRSDFLENNFRYGLTARLGLKYLRFFANYDLVPLFQKDRGPELYPVSIGISLISF